MTDLSKLVLSLSEQAEAVCRKYLSNGKRVGHYWVVGDVHNGQGGSMKVRLYPSKNGAVGRWVDYASGEYGDLLDIIRLSLGLIDMRDVIGAAETFLSAPRTAAHDVSSSDFTISADYDRQAAVKRLWSIAKPINGTLAERYLRSRAIVLNGDMASLRFHPRCFFKSDGELQHLPAMIAAFTDKKGALTGLHRTFLDVSGAGKATIAQPRKAMGELTGSSICFSAAIGYPCDVQLVGEGIETVLSLHMLMPSLGMQAAGSSAHLPSIPFAKSLRRLYIAHDNDEAGSVATERLMARANQSGIEAIVLMPHHNDFNDDLRTLDAAYLRQRLRLMLRPQDRHLCQAG